MSPEAPNFPARTGVVERNQSGFRPDAKMTTCGCQHLAVRTPGHGVDESGECHQVTVREGIKVEPFPVAKVGPSLLGGMCRQEIPEPEHVGRAIGIAVLSGIGQVELVVDAIALPLGGLEE